LVYRCGENLGLVEQSGNESWGLFMSGTVISTYTTVGLTLTASSQNPVTITQTGVIDTSLSNAIDGVSLASPWTIENLGTLESTRTRANGQTTYGYGTGIQLTLGTIVNGSSGYIYGSEFGVFGGDTNFSMQNDGTIAGGRYGGEFSGGNIVNGSETDTTALIRGESGLSGSANVTNFSTIEGGIEFGGPVADTLINGSETDRTALISGTSQGILFDLGTLENFGTIQSNSVNGGFDYSVAMLTGGLIVNNGLIAGGGGVLVSLGGTLINTGTIIGDPSIGRAVEFDSSDPNTGSPRLIIDPGAVIIGTVESTATITLELASAASRGTISGLGTQFTDIEPISIDTGATWVISGDSAGLAAGQSITGFSDGDTLVLDGFTATSSAISGNDLVLSDGTASETLDISTTVDAPTFHFSAVVDGTEVTLCYLRGTNISTPRGDVPIEALAIGDEVVTCFSGVQRIKWLGRQAYDRRFVMKNPSKMPVRIAAGALGAGLPRRDLFVSPGHSMLLGGQLVLAARLVNGVTISQTEAPARIDYIHIELETHDCVLAEGCWSESFADAPGLRAQCHNAAEFHALYPNAVVPVQLSLCAPRPDAGLALETAMLPVAALATMVVQPGVLRGFIDHVSADGVITGWAQDMAHPELPVIMEVWAQCRLIGLALACRYREDLAAAGLGSGRHGFAFRGPPGMEARHIVVRRAIDGAMLALEAGLRDWLAA
jgi:hypothetical protein